MIATLCSHLSGESCTNGIKMLDGFTKLCSNYKKRGVACQPESIQMDSFCYKNVKVVNLRANANSGVGR